MYEKHFGFLEEPFGVTPDPKFLYCSPGHTEALSALHYGLLERRGLLVLIAEPGMGKTTLLHRLLDRWRERSDSAFLFRPPETREQMIAAVLEDLGMEPGADYAESCHRLRDRAAECCRQGRRLLLIFDEAQGIPPAVLEEIRLLTNLETPEEKLVDIVLAGQPGLAEGLNRPGAEQLEQRVAIWTGIGELDGAEVRRYVEHRLRVAGRKRGTLLTGRALSRLAKESEGVPRTMNAICFEALSVAFAEGRKRIGERDIRRAAAALTQDRAPAVRCANQIWEVPHPFRWVAAATLAGLAAGALAGAAYFHRAPEIVGAAFSQVESREVAPAQDRRAPAESAPATDPVEAEPAEDDTAQEVEEAVPAAVRRVKVQAGDTMRRIALRHYGRWDKAVWKHIQKSNPRLTDPSRLMAGQILVLTSWGKP